MDYKDKFKKGLIEMLLLKILSEHDCYGYQITQILKSVSDGDIVVREPSMYPILYKLQERDMITSYKRRKGRMERVYYHIEEAGREELKTLMEAYYQVQRGTAALLNYEAEEGLQRYVE